MSRDFSGSTANYYSLPDDPLWDVADEITACAWIHADDFPEVGAIFGRFEENTNSRSWSLVMDSPTNGNARLDISASGNFRPANVVEGAHGASTGRWHHVALWHDGVNETRFYRDGTLVLTGDAGDGGGLDESAQPIRLGRTDQWGGVTRTYNGRMAEFAIYNKALRTEEILALAKGTSPALIRPTALISYIPLRGLNSVEADLSPSGIEAIVSGTVNVHATHSPVGPNVALAY